MIPAVKMDMKTNNKILRKSSKTINVHINYLIIKILVITRETKILKKIILKNNLVKISMIFYVLNISSKLPLLAVTFLFIDETQFIFIISFKSIPRSKE